MALSFVGVLDKQGSFPMSRFHLLINGIQKLHYHFTVQSKLITYHIVLSDILLKSSNRKLESVYGDDGWNHLDISYQKTSIKGVQFTSPRSPKRAYSELPKAYLRENFQSFPKRSRGSQGMEIGVAPDMKQLEVKSGYDGVSQRLWWKLVNSTLCPVCGTEPETVEHVFLFCPWTGPLWFGSDFQWCIDVSTVQNFQLWLYQKLVEIHRVYPENANQESAQVGSICWVIWKRRNEFVLEGNLSIL
ncbi:hypothetical protein VNO78_02946 [Psophocarpus tetragonolobus]|uniref:Reverse transcriptase zinc-binding domain-containing protein n=1 Tax=Psophocarpus tetragonolobus TaxID=3891 RepID=A0AAN9XW56_PSOTE